MQANRDSVEFGALVAARASHDRALRDYELAASRAGSRGEALRALARLDATTAALEDAHRDFVSCLAGVC